VRALAQQVDALGAEEPPRARIEAAHRLGLLAQSAGDAGLALRQLDAAVELQSLVVAQKRWLDRSDQEYRLGEHADVTSDCVGAHLSAGDAPGAVEMAELGHGLLLAADLSRRGGGVEPPSRPDYRALARASATGPVVLVNAAEFRSDALILASGDAPMVLRLPQLTVRDVARHAERLLELAVAPSAASVRTWRSVLADMLSWLWESVTGPVLQALGNATHVCWLPIGPLAQFPLHAACLPGQRGVLERVVSSYTPTLRQLAQARSRRIASVRRQLTVAPVQSPGTSALEASAAEADTVSASASGGEQLRGSDATAQRVLKALRHATWAHFACHATADLISPSNGGLNLADGLLPLSAISALDLPDAQLAYLSACSTASAGPRLADQALHLASAFQLAGFRHVIASLWPVGDQAAAAVAQAFYQALPGGGPGDPARTLNQVSRELRAAYPDRPEVWASFVHYGP
jgi:hypothetical protein